MSQVENGARLFNSVYGKEPTKEYYERRMEMEGLGFRGRLSTRQLEAGSGDGMLFGWMDARAGD